MKKVKIISLTIGLLFFSYQIANAQNLKGIWRKAKTESKNVIKKKVRKKNDVKTIIGNTSTNNELGSKSLKIDYRNELVVKSPSETFMDITIQSFKGLPRLGVQDDYQYTLANISDHNQLTKAKNELKRKRLSNTKELNKYLSLVETKFRIPLFEKMNKNSLTTAEEINNLEIKKSKTQNITETYNDSEYQTLQSSRLAQNHLLNTVYSLGSVDILRKYFCNSKNTNCNEFNGNNQNNQRYITRNWGGRKSTIFEQNRIYSDFVSSHLEELITWSNSIWDKNSKEVYLVNSFYIQPNNYDFQNKGFWTNSILRNGASFGLDNKKDSYFRNSSKKWKENWEKDMLFSLSEVEAEKIAANGQTKLYAVYKIKVEFDDEPIQKNASLVEMIGYKIKYRYEIIEPIMEVYSDLSLEEKIGEINLNTALFRN
tara:strand:+ start:457 stop:1737 length:1281 start_codon:yes stop_codon:yes gene_type:complete